MNTCSFNSSPSLKELREQLQLMGCASAREEFEKSILWGSFNCLKAKKLSLALDCLLRLRNFGKYEASVGIALYVLFLSADSWTRVQALYVLLFCDFDFTRELLKVLNEVICSLGDDKQKAVLNRAWEAYGRNNLVGLVVRA